MKTNSKTKLPPSLPLKTLPEIFSFDWGGAPLRWNTFTHQFIFHLFFLLPLDVNFIKIIIMLHKKGWEDWTYSNELVRKDWHRLALWTNFINILEYRTQTHTHPHTQTHLIGTQRPKRMVIPWKHSYGWNHPGSTSLLAECHQIMCKADVLPGSFFQRNARIFCILSMKGSVPRICKNIFNKVSQKNWNFRLKIGYNSR